MGGSGSSSGGGIGNSSSGGGDGGTTAPVALFAVEVGYAPLAVRAGDDNLE